MLRALWRDFGQRGRGVPEQGAEAWMADWIEGVTGVAVRDVLHAGLLTCDELPVAATAQAFGLELQWTEAQTPPWLGAEIRSGARGEAVLGTVYRGAAAELAGLAPQDELLAIDGLRVTRANLDGHLKRYLAGDALSVHVFRRDELLVLELVLQAPAPTQARLQRHPTADAAALARFVAWSGIGE